MAKTRLNVSLDQDLAGFAKVFAAENRTSVVDMIIENPVAVGEPLKGNWQGNTGYWNNAYLSILPGIAFAALSTPQMN